MVIVKESSIHHKGVFAKKNITKGTRIIEYVGEKITLKESDIRAQQCIENNKQNQSNGAVYIFSLNKRYDIDGNVPYNTARYINHSCDPNAEAQTIRGKIWIIALRDIRKGEEITYNYGYDIDDYEDHPCECKTHRCVGYILNEELWGKLKEHMKKNIKQTERNSHGTDDNHLGHRQRGTA
jgi:SET domain-containing protein